jgi:hypothetical protein
MLIYQLTNVLFDLYENAKKKNAVFEITYCFFKK